MNKSDEETEARLDEDREESMPSVVNQPLASKSTSRFPVVDEAGFQRITEASLSKATAKSTAWGVKSFRCKIYTDEM
jgi:hypothetical protein